MSFQLPEGWRVIKHTVLPGSHVLPARMRGQQDDRPPCLPPPDATQSVGGQEGERGQFSLMVAHHNGKSSVREDEDDEEEAYCFMGRGPGRRTAS